MSYLTLPTSVRSLNRLRRIARVLARHGFGHIVERLNLVRYLPFGKLLRGGEVPVPEGGSSPMMGRRMAAVCTELGPTFVKLGQMLSTRPDLLPADILVELRSLQDRVPPFDTTEARKIITHEIGAPIDEAFAAFGDEPIASGSIGQVYRAKTNEGADVVVKVRRPDIDQTIRLDLHLLKWLAQSGEQWVPELAPYHPTQIVEEFEQLLTRELDFINEASATARFEEALSGDRHLSIPHVHWELTGPMVLTLGRIDGKNIDALLNGEAAGIDRPLLARRLVNLYLTQFFDLRQFHADPHPGNFLITGPAHIGLIDFGQVATISDELAGQLVIIIVAMIYKEPQIIVDVLSDLGAVGPETDSRMLARSLRQLLDKYYGLPLHRLNLSDIFSELNDTIRRHNVSLPRELVLVLKTLTMVAGVALKLDPDFNLVEVFSPRIKGLVADRLSPRRLARTAGVSLWHIFSIIKSAPEQLHRALRRVSQGKWQINIRHENLDRLTRELDRSSNRMAFAVVIAAVIIGSSVVISADATLIVLGIPIQWIGIAGYLFAGVLGVGLLWAILRSGRLS